MRQTINMYRDLVKRICLGFPSATLDHPWDEDHDAYKIGGKMFALVGSSGIVLFKVSEMVFEALIATSRAFPAPYLARAKWVQINEEADWTEDELADHLRAAYEIILSKLTKKTRRDLGLG